MKISLKPKKLRLNSNLGVAIIAWLTIADGLIAIIKPIEERLPDKLSDLLQPINVPDFNSLLLTAVGLSLVYLGIELFRRKKAAWIMALVVSSINLGLHIVIKSSLGQIALSVLPVIVLAFGQDWFHARLQSENIWRGIRVLAFSVVFVLAYGTTGFWLLDKRDFGLTFSFGQAFSRTLRSYLLVGNDLQPRTIYGRWFLHSLVVVGLSALAFSLFSLFRPLNHRLRVQPGERRQAEKLLRRYGGETDDFFKLWPTDKSYFFSPDKRAYLAYGVARGVAVCFAGPSGRPASVPALLGDFKAFCHDNGLLPVMAQATDRFASDLKQAGFRDLVIGADAVVDLEVFNSRTAGGKYFRNIKNRFDSQGFTTELLERPHSLETLRAIRMISNDWQKRAGRKQWRFFTGHYSKQYLQQTPLFVLKDKHQKLLAFVNLLPNFKPGEATIDLMRSRRKAPTNTMDFLFLKLFEELSGQGYKYFNLGLSPQAAGQFADSPSDRLIARLYSADQKIISFKGLHQYKSKFKPDWQPRYLYYYGQATRLPQIGLAVAKLIQY